MPRRHLASRAQPPSFLHRGDRVVLTGTVLSSAAGWTEIELDGSRYSVKVRDDDVKLEGMAAVPDPRADPMTGCLPVTPESPAP